MDEILTKLREEYGEVLAVRTKSHLFVFKHPQEKAFALVSRYLDKMMNNKLGEGAWELVSALVVYPQDAKEILTRKPALIPYLAGKIFSWLGGDEIEEELSPFAGP